MKLKSRQSLVLFLTAYAVCLLALLSRLPLWLDEIVDLQGIRKYHLAQLIAWIPFNAGGVPLGYLTRFWTIHLFGYSVFSARLPSALFSLVACAGVFSLARQLNLRQPLLACLLFALAPLQLRYALESRPYSLALALSIWATVVFLRLAKQPTIVGAVSYGLLVLLGLYTQPFSLFVPLTHLCWLAWPGNQPTRWRLFQFVALPVAVAALGFLPWYLSTTHIWAESVAAQHLHYLVQWQIIGVISHELVGAGYWGTALILLIAGFGLVHLPALSTRLFWFLCLLLPVVFAVTADAFFGYFFAIRQILFAIVPLCLMAAVGLERAAQRPRLLSMAAAVVLVGVFVGADIRYLLRPRENWQAASVALQSVVQNGACILFVPANTTDLYEFFVPGLAKAACSADLSNARSVAVALSPYAPQVKPGLLPANLRKMREMNSSGPRVELYEP